MNNRTIKNIRFNFHFIVHIVLTESLNKHEILFFQLTCHTK